MIGTPDSRTQSVVREESPDLVLHGAGMTTSARFVVSAPQWSSNLGFDLEQDCPWSGKAMEHKRAALRLGWRCACFAPWTLSDAIGKFVESGKGLHTENCGGYTVRVAARTGPLQSELAFPVIVDLWIQRPRYTTSRIRAAERALEMTRQCFEKRLGLGIGIWKLELQQEFIELRLPRFVGLHFDSHCARVRIAPHLRQDYPSGGQLPSLRVKGLYLSVGPEHPGVIDAVRKFLEEETNDQAKEAILESDSYHRLRYLPIFMASLIILTWAFPLKVWSVILIGVFLILILVAVLFPVRDVGWRTILSRTSTITTAGIFGIGVFGIAYSICALFSEKELGHVTRLGYPFLVATGLGVAGGVLGNDPSGVALVLAHIQLLLFLGGIMGAIAVLLRIERATRGRG